MVVVVPSLKYLCFVKVIKEVKVEDYKVLPTSLIRDINLVKKFNGNYVNNDIHQSETLTILYDGNNWNFKLHTLRHVDDYGEDVCYCINCRDLDSELVEATVSEGKIVPAFSRMQTLLSLQEFDLRLEIEDETRDGRRALVFHGKEIGGARIYTVRLLVCSDSILRFTLSDWQEWFYPSEGT